jgi:hypothetical protein
MFPPLNFLEEPRHDDVDALCILRTLSEDFKHTRDEP